MFSPRGQRLALTALASLVPLLTPSALLSQDAPPVDPNKDLKAAVEKAKLEADLAKATADKAKSEADAAKAIADKAKSEADAADAEKTALEAMAEAQKAKLTLESNLATLQSNIATANKTEREAIYGTTLTPLPGTVTTNSKIESSLMAYKQMDSIAKAITGDLADTIPPKSTIVLVPGSPDATLQTSLRAYESILKDLGKVKEALTVSKARLEETLNPGGGHEESVAKMAPLSVLGGLDAGASALQAVMSLVALARVNRAYTGVEVSVDDTALVSSVAGSLLGDHMMDSSKAGLPPGKIIPKFDVRSSGLYADEDRLVTALQDVALLNAEVKTLVKAVEAEIASQTKDISDLKTKAEELKKIIRDSNKPGEVEDAKVELATVEKQIKDKTAALAKYKAGFKKKPATDSAPAVEAKPGADENIRDANVQVAKADDYAKAVTAGQISGIKLTDLFRAGMFSDMVKGDGGSYLVFLHVNVAGGTNLTRQTILTNSFRVSGGMAASYQAIDKDFKTVAARTYYGYDGFYKVGDRSKGMISGNVIEVSSVSDGGANSQSTSARGQGNHVRLGHPGR